MPERVTAQERLDRILYLLPLAARRDGARLDELANALGLEPGEILRDIEEVTARAYYHPAGSVDALELSVEGDRVKLWSKTEFGRPIRLSRREALALGLGLRVLASEADADRQVAVLALANRLEAALAVPPPVDEAAPPAADLALAGFPGEPYADDEAIRPVRAPGRPAAAGTGAPVDRFDLELEDDAFRAVVADAARDRRRCRIRYLKPGDEAPSERVIRPYMLAFAEGLWYVVGDDEASGQRRVFRMDRILDAELEADGFERPDDFDPAAFVSEGRVYRADDEVVVSVRYSPRIARWVAERIAGEHEPDGAYIVRHDVADTRWIIRHVLQYGPEAEILEPAAVRALAARAVERLSA